MDEFLDDVLAILGVRELTDYECVRCQAVLTRLGYVVHRLVCT